MSIQQELEAYLNDSLPSKIIKSKVPLKCSKQKCILGIDEAGRGPVLGPMCYSVAYHPEDLQDDLIKMKFADSKELTHEKRTALFDNIGLEHFSNLGYIVKIISPNVISNSMLRRNKYNLNSLSHDTAIELIRLVKDSGVSVSHVFLDAVGPTDKYKAKLVSFFPDTRFTVTNKADSIYPIVSAASVCAKVIRDRVLEQWKFLESKSLRLEMHERGSGYPSDPVTKKFLVDVLDPVFGFPTLARFSWSTVSNILKKDGVPCDWNEPDEDSVQQVSKQAGMMKSYFNKKPKATTDKITHTSCDSKTNTTSTVSNCNLNRSAVAFFQNRQLSRVETW